MLTFVYVSDFALEHKALVQAFVIIASCDTGRSKGFGFVEMADDNAADAAIATLNGKEVDGRRVRVNVAEEKPRRPRFNRDDGAGRY